MCKIVHVLVCLVCASYGRRMQSSMRQFPDKQVPKMPEQTVEGGLLDPMKTLATLLSSSKPAGAFSSSVLNARMAVTTPRQAVFHPVVSSGHLGRRVPVSMAQDLKSKVQVGDIIKCRILEVDEAKRSLLITRRDISGLSRESILQDFQVGDQVEGTVLRCTPGCVVVDIGAGNVRAILPNNQISNDEVLSEVETRQMFREGSAVRGHILHVGDNQITLTLRGPEAKLQREVDDLQVGEIVEGTVRDVGDEWAFLDIGASKDAILRFDKWHKPIADLRNELAEGDTLNVRILHVIANKRVSKPIYVTCKNEDEEIEGTRLDELRIGDEVEGEITFVGPYFAFVDVGAQSEGILRSYQVDAGIDDLRDILRPGDMINCRILRVRLDTQQLSLTCRDTNDERVGEWLRYFDVGEEYMGKIKRFTEHGIFLDIGVSEHTDALLPNYRISKAAWEELMEGDSIRVKITHIDYEKQQLMVACEDIAKTTPGGTPLEELTVGDVVEGEVNAVTNFGAFVNIGAETVALLPTMHFPEEWLRGPSRELEELSEFAGEEVKKRAQIMSHIFPGDTIKCRIGRVDLKKRQIALTCRDDVKPLREFKVGDEVEGEVKVVKPYGAIVDINCMENQALLRSEEM